MREIRKYRRFWAFAAVAFLFLAHTESSAHSAVHLLDSGPDECLSCQVLSHPADRSEAIPQTPAQNLCAANAAAGFRQAAAHRAGASKAIRAPPYSL